MTNFYTLTRTELVEAAKEFKFIWLTLFFVILGLTQPLITKYMDVILENVGGADGITIDPNRPVPSSAEVLLSTISGQFNQIGLIILIISFMGLIAADRNSGMQDFILTRPVSLRSYLLSKLAGHWAVSMFSISIGAAVSYGYTIFLFGSFSFSSFGLFLLLYSLWILFVVSLAILISTFVKSPILDGVSIEKNPREFKQMVGYSPDTPVLYGNMTGYSYLELIGSIYQIDNATMNEQLNTLLKKLNFGSAIHELISTYSHGMKQRLVLISILMHNPKLIILDEPFVGLDPNATYFLQEEMKKRATEGSIVLYSTHVLEVAEKLCNKVVMIHNGEVVVNDTMINLLSESSLGEKFRSITAHE